MKKFITILVFAAGLSLHAGAQTFLTELQKSKQGEGKVTVKQSADIDNLVNSAQLKASSIQAQQQAQQQTTANGKSPATTHARQDDKGNEATHKTEAAHHAEAAHRAESAHKAEAAHKADAAERHTAKTATEAEAMERPVVDTSKKVMRNSYKVTGYRIQAYSGGNSGADKAKARKIGNAIKMKFPDQPVYVHFYSPRWICRVGNFRSYEEASQLLRSIKAMGYHQACIVKGKISVAY